MNIKMKIAFGCYFISGLILLGFGFAYLTRTEFMPYHAAAVATPWAEVPANFQVLILALLKVVGGTFIALALTLYVILFIPFRQGAAWALWTTPLIVLLQTAATLNGMAHVALNTSAQPPFMAPLAAGLLCIVAFVLSIAASKQRPTT